MKVYKGIPGAPGAASGRVLYFEKNAHKTAAIGIDEAIENAVQRVSGLAKKAYADLGEDKAKIFEAYKMLLEDEVLTGQIRDEIANGSAAEDAVTHVTAAMAAVLASKKNEYLRQRAEDIRYIGELLKSELAGGSDFAFPEGDEKFILAAHELTPVDTMAFDHSRIAGLVCEAGGATSHTVILAKSIGIPAVVGADGIMSQHTDAAAYIDGYSGKFITDPDAAAEKQYESLLEDERRFALKLEEIKKNDARTADGERVSVLINIGKPSDAADLGGEKIDGVGLFRSEFLYSAAAEKPSVREQITAYKKVIDAVYPNPVTVRTIDVGGDKQIPYLNMKHEENPFLGSRGIRLCLNNREIFAEQLEALLIAGEGKSIKIMLPMITRLAEIRKTREMLDEIRRKLDAENTKYCERVSLGIMIETPAAAITADVFAHQCDFFSIGTNDLVQYITAADRGNADVEEVYNPYHPAVLKTINHVIKSAKEAGIDVSVCGDLAANTDFTEVLLGMGLTKFSVPLPVAGRIKHKIGTIGKKAAEALAQKALAAEDEEEVIRILRKE